MSPIIVCVCSVAEASSALARSRSEAARLRTASSVNVSPAKRRPEAVVEVATDAATLLLPQFDQATARSLQLLREADGVRRRRDLGREVGDQSAVCLTQLFAGSRRETEFSDGNALMHERESERGGRGDAVGAPPPPRCRRR